MPRPLLILDLDETLVHASESELPCGSDFVCGEYFVRRRPYLTHFIDRCASTYCLAVWTSATGGYAASVVDRIFGEVPLAFVWARDRCTNRFNLETQERYWVKDLKKVRHAGHDLARVLVVDDTPQKLERNYGNLVLVREFTGDPEDRELYELADYLVALADVADFRKIEKRHWRAAR